MSREGYLSLAELQYFLIEFSDKHLTEPHQQLKQSSYGSSLKSQFINMISLKIMSTHSLNHITFSRNSTLSYRYPLKLMA